MTDTQATPRPWRAEGRDAICDAKGEPVAHVFPHKVGGHWTLEEMEAHRQLIVQAVNAFDAMREALNESRRLLAVLAVEKPSFAEAIAETKAQIAAALAAAEGKEKANDS